MLLRSPQIPYGLTGHQNRFCATRRQGQTAHLTYSRITRVRHTHIHTHTGPVYVDASSRVTSGLQFAVFLSFCSQRPEQCIQFDEENHLPNSSELHKKYFTLFRQLSDYYVAKKYPAFVVIRMFVTAFTPARRGIPF